MVENMLVILQEILFAILFSVSAVGAADLLMRALEALRWLI